MNKKPDSRNAMLSQRRLCPRGRGVAGCAWIAQTPPAAVRGRQHQELSENAVTRWRFYERISIL